MATENPWIEWTGGECPVDPTTPVQVQFSQETRHAASRYPARPASHADWKRSRDGAKSRVIAYRVVSA